MTINKQDAGTIVAASRNKHKIEEIAAITSKFGMKLISRDDAGIPKFEIEEDGETFEENSFKKAIRIWNRGIGTGYDQWISKYPIL